MSVMKYKDPTTGEIKKVGAPKYDVYSKTETDTLLAKKTEYLSNENLIINWDFGNLIDLKKGYVVPPGVQYRRVSDYAVMGTTDKYYQVASTDGVNPYFYVGDVLCYVAHEEVATPFVRGYTNHGYGIDRWKNYANITAVIESDCITLRNDTSEIGYYGQPMDANLWDKFVGKIVTMSLLTGDGALYSGTGEFGTHINFPVGTGVGVYMWPSAKESFDFSFDAGASIAVRAVKLELGDQQTLAHQDADGNWVLNEVNFQPPTTKKSTITLSTNWTGDSSPYTQTVTIPGTTSNSKVDLQPDATAIAQMVEDGTIAMYIVNNDGTLTAYAVGEKPTVELTVQATITEVI